MDSIAPKLILVPTDFSEAAGHALRYASALADRFNAHLLVVYADAFLPPIDFTAAPAGAWRYSRDAMIDEAREQLEEHAERNIQPNVPYDVRVAVGEPRQSILDQVREVGADLIVMGTHGRTGLPRLLFGSVTESVIRTASIPVIAVNPKTRESAAIGKVLCAVTLTPACREAVRRAATLVDNGLSPLVLFRQVDHDDLQASVDELVRVRKWIPAELRDRCELKLLPAEGDAEQILDLAATTGADLIALGVPAGRSVAESLRGTVAERVVQQSGCPVLTVSAFAAGVLPAARTEERELAATP